MLLIPRTTFAVTCLRFFVRRFMMLNFRSVLAVIAIAFGIATTANAQIATSMRPGPQIATTGRGEARVTPDRATIFIGVQSRAATAAVAAAENARKQRAVLDTLKSLGFAANQLSTANYNVSPEMTYPSAPGQSPRVTGYTVTNTVRVDARRIEDVSKAIDGALAKGANEISSLQFYSSVADSARKAALADAVANARADAEVLARAAGGSLGPLLELSTGSLPVQPLDAPAARVMAAARPTPIEPGEQTVDATVSARWAFVSK